MPLGAEPPPEFLDEGLFRRLIDLAPDAMVGVDRRGRIVLVNTQAEVLFGYRREQLLGEQIEILVPEAARGVHPAHRDSYVADQRFRPMGLGLQLAARRSDGSEFPAEISLASVAAGGGGEEVLISASIRDITERLAAERERERLTRQAQHERSERKLLQSQRLESLGQLAGGIAHDFNNLLAVIANYTSFVHEEIENEIGRTGADRWRMALSDIIHVEQASELAATLTRQLLTFARREVVRPQAIDLNTVVRETAGLLERTLGEDIELDVRLGSSLELILADPSQIQQVLVNLAINSRHAMPHGGVLTISTQNDLAQDDLAQNDLAQDDLAQDERTSGGGTMVRLTVSDTGIGMDAAALARAFEPFFTTRSAEHGTGLGLATVHGIVTQAGGTAVLESELGVGTVFIARFPVSRESPDDVDVATRTAAQQAEGVVLVVDDEPAIRDLVARMLVRNGYEVLVAATAADARRFVLDRGATIDLVLSDVIMPVTSGPELVAELRSICPDLRVVFMSGYAGDELARRSGLDDGVVLLEKPFGQAALLAAVSVGMTSRSGARSG